MSAMKTQRPATLRVFRYDSRREELRPILGDELLPLPEAELLRHAREAMQERAFLVHTITDSDADELCFVPYDGRCEILSIHSNGWRRNHGDHRRNLMQILHDLAAAVACGRLRLLDQNELEGELMRCRPLASRPIRDSESLTTARRQLETILEGLDINGRRREQTLLCASEACTNTLVHGGGTGVFHLVLLHDRLRMVVADRGPGLNFLNWLRPGSSQASMGYGYKIILDHIDDVGLHSGPAGTTLILDQRI